jgi:hypothetical protein
MKGQFHGAIPVGTKVLTRGDGLVGVVVHAPSSPEHGYRVRFAQGAEESFRRNELTIFKQAEASIPGAGEVDLYPFVIYRCVVGSTAYGLRHEGSDVDRRGFYLPPANLHWSFGGVPEQLESDQEESVLGDRKIHPIGVEGQPQHSGVPLLTAGGNLHSTSTRIGRHAEYFPIAVCSSHVQFVRLVAVQEN